MWMATAMAMVKVKKVEEGQEMEFGNGEARVGEANEVEMMGKAKEDLEMGAAHGVGVRGIPELERFGNEGDQQLVELAPVGDLQVQAADSIQATM